MRMWLARMRCRWWCRAATAAEGRCRRAYDALSAAEIARNGEVPPVCGRDSVDLNDDLDERPL
jgi:hypothetical protein